MSEPGPEASEETVRVISITDLGAERGVRTTRRGPLVAPPPDGQALADLLAGHRSWADVPARIPPAATLMLWALLPTDGAVAAWLLGVRRASLGCSGPLCRLATLGGHPLLTLCLALASLVLLLVAACLTKAFTAGTAPVLLFVWVSALTAVAAVTGAVLAVLLIALLAALVLSMLVLVLLTMASP